MILDFIKNKINQNKLFEELDKIVNQLTINGKINKSYLEPRVESIIKRIYNTKSLFIKTYTINKNLHIEVTIPKSIHKGKDIQLDETTYIFPDIEFDYCVSSNKEKN